jgi:Heparinase II/III-like protein
MGATHRRKVLLNAKRLTVEDDISNFKKSACLRWRLCPGNWKLQEGSNGIEALLRDRKRHIRIAVKSNVKLNSAKLVTGFESLHYGEKSVLPVFEIVVDTAARLTTQVEWWP